ncbi:hypothetical protein SUGI_0284900 [Cryptomeria japonica]|nr:hypothetical protein SUGI_0284900 [Cryptomeria japonica]
MFTPSASFTETEISLLRAEVIPSRIPEFQFKSTPLWPRQILLQLDPPSPLISESHGNCFCSQILLPHLFQKAMEIFLTDCGQQSFLTECGSKVDRQVVWRIYEVPT